MAWDEDRGLARNSGLVEVAERQTGSILAFLLRLIADSPLDSLSGLPQAGRAFDEQPPYALSVFRPEPPKKEPLDVPVMTGGVGHAELRQFYATHFIPKMPPDTWR